MTDKPDSTPDWMRPYRTGGYVTERQAFQELYMNRPKLPALSKITPALLHDILYHAQKPNHRIKSEEVTALVYEIYRLQRILEANDIPVPNPE